MKLAWCIVAALMLPLESRADHRFLIDPSLQVNEVNDDNLNYSIDKPLRDRVNRITPALDLRFDSPRLRVFGTYSLDSERYANNSALNDDRARQRAGVDIKYDAAPRLMLSMQSTYIDTNTQADLNVDTGLAALRAHGRSLSVGSSARLRVSPRFTATVSSTTLTTNVVNGTGMRSQVRALILGERVTPRDLFNIHYENNNLSFSGATSQRIHTQFFLARWIHQIGMHDSVTVQAGPRLTDGSPSVDVAAILSHTWRLSSITLSYVRNQTQHAS